MAESLNSYLITTEDVNLMAAFAAMPINARILALMGGMSNANESTKYSHKNK